VRTRLWRSLASQLALVQLILIAAVLVAVSAVSVEQTRRQFQTDQTRRVLALAENLAATAVIRRGPVIVDDATLPAATAQLQQVTGVAVVLITDRRARCWPEPIPHC
jgi:two-component system CitB family sensor kinase